MLQRLWSCSSAFVGGFLAQEKEKNVLHVYMHLRHKTNMHHLTGSGRYQDGRDVSAGLTLYTCGNVSVENEKNQSEKCVISSNNVPLIGLYLSTEWGREDGRKDNWWEIETNGTQPLRYLVILEFSYRWIVPIWAQILGWACLQIWCDVKWWKKKKYQAVKAWKKKKQAIRRVPPRVVSA